MSELPSHPDTDHDGADRSGRDRLDASVSDRAIASGSRRGRILTIAAVVALVVVFVVLHLTGVLGAETH